MGRKRTVKAVVITLILTLLIVGGVAFFLTKQVSDKKDLQIKELEEQISKIDAYAFSTDLKAGSVITPADVSLIKITQDSKTVGMYLAGNGGWTDSEKVYHPYANYLTGVVNGSETTTEVLLDEYVYGRSVKANVSKNTPVLESLLYAREGADSKDMRLEEISDSYMTLPTDLQEADYIDVRIQFPTGEDYTVLVGKKIEALGRDSNGDPISSSAYIKMSEEERMLMGSAIIEAYIQDGMRIYSTKYIDPATQLFKESILNYVEMYENGVKAALDAKNGEPQAEQVQEPQTNESGEVINNSPYVSSSQIYTERDLTIEEIAQYAGMSVDHAKAIQEAKNNNDTATLEYYRHFRVQTKTPIEKTYAVKDEVLAVVRNNPNLVETIKQEFNTRELAKTRVDKYKELEAQLATAPTQKDYYNNDVKTKAEIQAEMDSLLSQRASSVEAAMKQEVEAQKARRVQYLQALIAGY